MTRKMIHSILFGLVALLSMPLTGGAATVGNTAISQGGSGEFSLGIEYDGVFNRDLDFKSGSRKYNTGFIESLPALGAMMEDVEMDSNRVLLKGTLGFHRDIDLDLFVKLGMANLNYEEKNIITGASDQKMEFDGEFDFAWGAGAKLGFYQSPKGLRIMGDVQYLTYEVDGDFSINGVDLATVKTPATYDSNTKVEEWQAALYMVQEIRQFSPYLGVKYSDLTLRNETNVSGSSGGVPYSYTETTKADADKNIGVLVGADFNIIPNQLSLNVEGRFLDETAGTVGVNWKF